DVLPASVLTELRGAGKVVRSSSDAEPTLLPAVAGAGDARAAFAQEKPGLLVEGLFRVVRPRPADAQAEQAAILNVLRSVSTLQGIEYWSRSHEAMRALFTDSYRI